MEGDHVLRRFLERRHVPLALERDRVAAGTRQLAVRESLLAGLGQRHQREAAEPDVPPPAVDHDPLHPSTGAARLDLEEQPVRVVVLPRLGLLDESGSQRRVCLTATLSSPSATRFHRREESIGIIRFDRGSLSRSGTALSPNHARARDEPPVVRDLMGDELPGDARVPPDRHRLHRRG